MLKFAADFTSKFTLEFTFCFYIDICISILKYASKGIIIF